MTETEFLEHVTRRLREAGVPSMVVGSVASSFHGEPRLSYDVGILVDATLDQLLSFVQSFDLPFYVSEAAMRQAFGRGGMFNVIHPESEYKADIVLQRGRGFDQAEFERRMPACIWGVDTYVTTAEDTILSKLEWSTKGESERQYRDAVRVAEVQGPALDLAYMRKWAGELGVTDLLERLLNEAT